MCRRFFAAARWHCANTRRWRYIFLQRTTKVWLGGLWKECGGKERIARWLEGRVGWQGRVCWQETVFWMREVAPQPVCCKVAYAQCLQWAWCVKYCVHAATLVVGVVDVADVCMTAVVADMVYSQCDVYCECGVTGSVACPSSFKQTFFFSCSWISCSFSSSLNMNACLVIIWNIAMCFQAFLPWRSRHLLRVAQANFWNDSSSLQLTQ